MTTAQIIEDKLEDFGLNNITDDTTVCVNKEDLTDVSVFDSEFNTFTKAYATCARYLVDFDGDDVTINRAAIREFVDRKCGD